MDNVITLFISILEENKIIFVSKQYSLLFVAIQSLITLTYPFWWDHIYIPVMGTKLKDFVHAPTPFLMGVPKECYESFRYDLENEVEDVTLVDLDYGRVRRPRGKLIYPKSRDKLAESLRILLIPQIKDVDEYFPESKEISCINKEIQVRFLQFFVELFYDYRKYISFVRKYPYPITTFDKTSFLAEKNKADKKFLTVFLNTQMFQVFSEVSPLQRPSIFEYACKKYNKKKEKFDFLTLVDSPKLCAEVEGIHTHSVKLYYTSIKEGLMGGVVNEPFPKLPKIVASKIQRSWEMPEEKHANVKCYVEGEELSVEVGVLRPYSTDWTKSEINWVLAFIDAIFEQEDISSVNAIFHNILLMEDGPLMFCTALGDYISRNNINIISRSSFETLSTVIYLTCLYIKDYS